MSNNTIIVTGAFGQDGSIMCEKLIDSGCKIIGLVKKNSNPNTINPKVDYIEFEDKKQEITNLIKLTRPHKIFNFMGISDVISPWDNPIEVYKNNFIFPIEIVEAIKSYVPKCKFLQSSSALIFGDYDNKFVNEETIRKPSYHYGFSKNFTDEIIKTYRKKFNLFLCSAIFFNHESEYRKDYFFSKKVVKGAIEIFFKKREFIELGNLDNYRDFGYARDYMEACLKIIDYNKPDDYIVSNGKLVKLYDFVKIVFDLLGLDINKSVKTNNNPNEKQKVQRLSGDNTKLKKLGWSPETNLEDMIKIMIEHELNEYTKNSFK